MNFSKVKVPAGWELLRQTEQCGVKALSIMMFLIQTMDKTNGTHLTHMGIAKACKCSVSTVQRRLKSLEQCGYIKHKMVGKANSYQINSRIVTKIRKRTELQEIGYELFDDKITPLL